MSADLSQQFKSLNDTILEKDSKISNLEYQLSFVKASNLNLTKQVDYLQKEISIHEEKNKSIIQDLNTKSSQLIELQNECEYLKSLVTRLEASNKSYQESVFNHSISELDMIRMMHCELESKYFSEKEEFLNREQTLKEMISQLSNTKTQLLLEKRQKWLNSLPSLENVPKKNVIEDESLDNIGNSNPAPLNLVSILKDVEFLLGWKLEYVDNRIVLSNAFASFTIIRQIYQESTFYNLELTAESIKLVSSPLMNSLIFDSKDYPRLFSLILSNSFIS